MVNGENLPKFHGFWPVKRHKIKISKNPTSFFYNLPTEHAYQILAPHGKWFQQKEVQFTVFLKRKIILVLPICFNINLPTTRTMFRITSKKPPGAF